MDKRRFGFVKDVVTLFISRLFTICTVEPVSVRSREKKGGSGWSELSDVSSIIRIDDALRTLARFHRNIVDNLIRKVERSIKTIFVVRHFVATKEVRIIAN